MTDVGYIKKGVLVFASGYDYSKGERPIQALRVVLVKNESSVVSE